MANYRTLNHWRYQMVKRWIQRVQGFRRHAKNQAQIEAWDVVEVWLKTLLKNGRYMDEKGVIRMYPVTDDGVAESSPNAQGSD